MTKNISLSGLYSLTWIALLKYNPTGCKKIDEKLGGGIHNKEVSLVYGGAETGKTTLAMQCAVNCARQNYKTLFVDCEGTFSARRFSQMVSRDIKSTGELILLMKPKDFTEQTKIIDRLTNYINDSFGLIVIDTFTSLYRAEISEDKKETFELNRELNRQMACLAQTAKTQEIAVLTTSQVRSTFENAQTITEPVATRVLKFWADTIIAMKPTGNPPVIKAVLEKTPEERQPLTFYLKIGEKGIHEYSTR